MLPARFILVALALQAVAGCATDRSTPADSLVEVAPGQYATTFDAARRVLRERGFILERVDAQAGVITTQPKTTAGLATPWDREQQSVAQEVEDLLERQQRVVRVTFEPAPGAKTGETSASKMRVQVTIQRVHIPGAKLEPEAITQSTFYWDSDLGNRGMQPQYAVAIRDDSALAARLTELIAEASR